MPESHPSEDKAALYLLGELKPDERREFEAELAQSAELRELVRELQESAVLLASLIAPTPPAAESLAIHREVGGGRCKK